MARKALDFSIDLELLPENNFSPFEQCLFLLNNLEGLNEQMKNSLKSGLIMTEVAESDLFLILQDFHNTRNPDQFIRAIQRVTGRPHDPAMDVKHAVGMTIHEESVSESIPVYSQRGNDEFTETLVDSSRASDSFILDMEEEEFVRPTKKAVAQSSLLAQLEISRQNTYKEPVIKQPTVERNFNSLHLPLQPQSSLFKKKRALSVSQSYAPREDTIQISIEKGRATEKRETKLHYNKPFRSPSPDLENQLRALNSTQQIRNTHSKINDAVQNFRAILAASKNYADTKMTQARHRGVNLSVDFIKSPFKQDVSSFLGDEVISPIRDELQEGTSTFTKCETRRLTVESENFDIPLLSPLQKPKEFNFKSLALATGLRYVKTSDLMFLLGDYTPDANITRFNFKRMIELLRDSVVGSDAPLPSEMLDHAIQNIWSFVETAQQKYDPDGKHRGDLNEEEYKSGNYANVIVVGPALIVLTKGTIEEKIQSIVEIVSKGGVDLKFEEVCGSLYQIYEMIYNLDGAPKVIQNKVSTFDLAKYCALSVYELAEVEIEKEKLHFRSLEYWITYPGSVGETMTESDCFSECGGITSHECSVACGITFRDKDIVKNLDEVKPAPQQVPRLDLSNTQGIKQLQEKCLKMIANAEKIKKRPQLSRVDTLESIERSIASRVATIDSKGSHRNSKSLVPLPSQRVNPMISPKRRQVPDAVKKYQRLNVIELEQLEALRLSSSFKETQIQEPETRHFKCSSMFMQTMKFMDEDDDQSETIESEVLEKKIEIPDVSPKYEELPLINVLCPQTTSNANEVVGGVKRVDDQVRFSTDSESKKMVRNKSRPHFRQAPKVLKFTIKGEELEEAPQKHQHIQLVAKENGVGSSVNAAESPNKKRNNRIAVLDYFLKH